MEKPGVSTRHLAFLVLSRVGFYPLWHNYLQVLFQELDGQEGPGASVAAGDRSVDSIF